MEERECKIIKEKCYMQKLDNGLQVIIIPKKKFAKKVCNMWGTFWLNR